MKKTIVTLAAVATVGLVGCGAQDDEGLDGFDEPPTEAPAAPVGGTTPPTGNPAVTPDIMAGEDTIAQPGVATEPEGTGPGAP
ncbi:MAG: hypothetical protein WD737_12805 [Gemmatimonadota bacterium]